MKPYIVNICSQSFENGFEVSLERNVLSDLSPKLLHAHFLLKNGLHHCPIRTPSEGDSFDDPLIVEESSFSSEFKSAKVNLNKTIIKRNKDKGRLEDPNFLAKAPKEIIQKVTDSYRILNDEVDSISEKLHKVEYFIFLDIEDTYNKINGGLEFLRQQLELYSQG
jgi:hypothetical protein